MANKKDVKTSENKAGKVKLEVKEFKGKKRTYAHMVEGIGTAKTSCKVFGGCMHDDKGNFVGDCSSDNCLESNDVRLACQIQTGISPISEAEIEKIKKQIEKGEKSGNSGNSEGTGKKREVMSDSLIKLVEFLKTGSKSMKEIQNHMGTKTTLYNICKRHENLIGRDGKKFFAIEQKVDEVSEEIAA